MTKNEETLTFRMPENHGSDDPVTLSPDNKAASLKAFNDLFGNLSFLHEMLGKDELTVGIRFSCLGNAESHMRRIGQLIDAGEDKVQTAELNKSQLRIANDEIARLRKEMAKGVTLEAIGNKLEVLHRSVRDWWKDCGFGMAEGKYVPNWKGANLNVEFSVYIEEKPGMLFEDEPVSAQVKINENLAKMAAGADLVKSNMGGLGLLDTPKSRAYIDTLILGRFPGTDIWDYHSMHLNGKVGEYQIKKVVAHIPIQAIELPG